MTGFTLALRPTLVSPFLFMMSAFCLVLVAGCDSTSPDDDGTPDPDPTPLTATLSSIQSRVFTGSCARSGCHSGNSPAEGLDLTSGQSFDALVNVASRQSASLLLVAPGDPDASYLINKLEGNGISGSRMPRGGSALPQATIDVIRQWIADGALNN